MSRSRKDVKDYVKSFGRVSVPPPTKVKGNKRGKGAYKRSKAKQELRRYLREI